MKCGLVIGIVFWAVLSAGAQAASAPGGAPRPPAQPSTRANASRPHPAVVRVVAPGAGSVSYGSGTLIAVNDKHGLVLTNWHVINEANAPISVLFPNGFQSGATVLKVDRDWDLAALAIWKPNVIPVALATEAPRAGDTLTIAGYGPGPYREATGRCTQYVAPGTRFPYEMVELSAAARQGDSGGPIFNDRGQLAGVLFGEGHGRTTGSYCGRVQLFLTGVVSDRKANDPAYVAVAQQSSASQPSSSPPSSSQTANSQQMRQQATSPPARRAATSPQLAQAPAAPKAAASRGLAAPVNVASPPTASEVSLVARDQPQRMGWREIAGETVGDQIKSALAGIGTLAMILHAIAWLGAESKPPKKAKAG